VLSLGQSLLGVRFNHFHFFQQVIVSLLQIRNAGLRHIQCLETTIPHQVLGVFASSQVLLKPAPAGTGVIAGGPVRAVISACGVPNVLTKSIGRRNPHNVVKATIVALESLRDRAQVAEMRGLAIDKL